MSEEQGADPVSEHLYEIDSADPRHRLVDRSDVSPDDIAQIGRLMRALADMRAAEQALSEASQKYMNLSQLDMRAIQYLMVAANRGSTVTPGMLAAHLEISAASTTKLLNRLERGGHVTREVHHEDRRAFALHVSPKTADSAMDTVGHQHAKRFHAAASLSPEEREVVIAFLEDVAERLSLSGVEWAAGDAEEH